jgi:hypothetical protein
MIALILKNRKLVGRSFFEGIMKLTSETNEGSCLHIDRPTRVCRFGFAII